VLLNLPIPALLSDVLEPLANANPFCSMLMVGMLMELPANGKDVRDLLQDVLGVVVQRAVFVDGARPVEDVGFVPQLEIP